MSRKGHDKEGIICLENESKFSIYKQKRKKIKGI